MAASAVSVAVDNESRCGGLVVAPAAARPPHPALQVVVGDHPEPGPGSLAAAAALGALASRVRAGDHVWVLLSGGTTSLIGAPLDGIPHHDLRDLYGILLGSGLDISAMNRVRERFTRWGGGKLAAASTAPPCASSSSPMSSATTCLPWLWYLRPRFRHRRRRASGTRTGRTLAGAPGHRKGARPATEDGTRPETPKSDHPAFRLGADGNCVE